MYLKVFKVFVIFNFKIKFFLNIDKHRFTVQNEVCDNYI